MFHSFVLDYITSSEDVCNTIRPISSSVISADSGDVGGADTALASEITDATELDNARRDSGSSEEEAEIENEEGELSGHSSDSSRHSTSAEQPKGRGGHREKPEDKKRKKAGSQVCCYKFLSAYCFLFPV